MKLCIIIASIAFVINCLPIFRRTVPLVLAGLFSYIIFCSVILKVILSFVIQDEQITTDKIFGAICVYLLIGLLWAFLYGVIEAIFPGSFSFGQDVLFDPSKYSHFIYYSFTTLTTLGYGDIIPLSAPAQSCSTLEAITGQLYVAILIARLVGLHISHSMKQDKFSEDKK